MGIHDRMSTMALERAVTALTTEVTSVAMSSARTVGAEQLVLTADGGGNVGGCGVAGYSHDSPMSRHASARPAP